MTPSWLRTCFTLAALLLVMLMVGLTMLGIIERHLEEHRHNRTAAVGDVEQVQCAEAQTGGEADQGGGGHASFFATGSVSDAVRRHRNGSDTP